MSIGEIKSVSKNLIHGKTHKGLFIKLCLIIFSCCFTVVSYVISTFIHNKIIIISLYSIIIFIFILFFSSINLGEKAWYNSVMTKSKNSKRRFIFWFLPKNSIKAFRFKSAIIFLKLLWTIITLLPSLALITTICILAYSGGIEVYLLYTLSAGAFVLFSAGLIFRFIIIQRYFLAEFLISSDPKLKVIQSIKQSKNLTDGQIADIVKFKLSFLPLFLSCLFIIPLFFIIPYYKQSCSVIAKAITI